MTIYLDNNATTHIHPRVLAAMEPFLSEDYGNPSSIQYEMGRRARRALDEAREAVAALLRCAPDEIVFTSGGSEANAQAVLSAGARQNRRRIVTSSIEHDSVRRTCVYARFGGYTVDVMPVHGNGIVDLAAFAAALRTPVSLVTILWANNETGAIQPVEEIVAMARSHGAQVHVDGVQALGKITIDLRYLPLDLLSLSAHKIHGPKGVGALFIREGVEIEPRIFGGPQERGIRAGTENVAGIVGFGAACALLLEQAPTTGVRVRGLRDELEAGLTARCPGIVVFGSREHRIDNTLFVGWSGIEAQEILAELDREGICASAGSACTSRDPEPSHVLIAMGISPELAKTAVRFSLSAATTAQEIVQVLDVMARIIADLRGRRELLAWAGSA